MGRNKHKKYKQQKQLDVDTFPNVVKVHQVVEYLLINEEVKEVKYCEFCKMCYLDTRRLANKTFCLGCFAVLNKNQVKKASRMSYLQIVQSLRLRNNGYPVTMASLTDARKWVRSYSDLTQMEIAELDLII